MSNATSRPALGKGSSRTGEAKAAEAAAGRQPSEGKRGRCLCRSNGFLMVLHVCCDFWFASAFYRQLKQRIKCKHREATRRPSLRKKGHDPQLKLL